MKKLFKIVLISLVSLFLITCVAGYIILSHIDLNQYKGKISELANQATGRQLTIGNIRIKPSFSPTIELSDITFSNAPWSKEPLMVSAKAVDASVAVIPLLHKNIVINFAISDAIVNLEENKDGVANWVFDTENSTQTENIPQPKPEDKTSFNFSLIKQAYADEIETTAVAQDNIISALVIEKVAFNNVKINYTDKTAHQQSYDIQSLTLQENDDNNIDFAFIINNGLYQGTGMIGAFALLDTNNAYPIKADLNVMGINIITDLQLFDVLGNIKFTGNIVTKGFMGKGSPYNEEANINITGDLKDIAATLNNLKIAGNIITGDINAKLDGKVPEINATLNSDSIDIAPFTTPATNKKTAWTISLIKEAQATSLAPADPIPYTALSSINADTNININKIINGKNTIAKNLKLNAQIKDGLATVKILQGIIANGNVNAEVKLAAKSKTLTANTNFTSINLKELLKALNADTDTLKIISGSNTDVHIKLTGLGNTYAAMIDSLNGQIALIIDKSELHLGNIGLMKGNILSQLLNTLKITKDNDDLSLTCAVVRADFKDGQAKFPNGIVVFADKFTVVANGDINLKNDKINLSIKPFGGKLTDTNIAKALSSLVKLTGTLQDPKIGVDSANALKTIVGVTTTGPMYLGAQMLMENDNSPCYTALQNTGYETRFPKPDNVAASSAKDVGKVLDDSVGIVKDTTKGLLNLLSGKKDKTNNAK